MNNYFKKLDLLVNTLRQHNIKPEFDSKVGFLIMLEEDYKHIDEKAPMVQLFIDGDTITTITAKVKNVEYCEIKDFQKIIYILELVEELNNKELNNKKIFN